MLISHMDSEIRLRAYAWDGEEDRCMAYAMDMETGQWYRDMVLTYTMSVKFEDSLRLYHNLEALPTA